MCAIDAFGATGVNVDVRSIARKAGRAAKGE
jgi:hypothetical protein